LLFVVTSAVFVLLRMTPGGPEAALAENPRVGREEMDRIRTRFGLNDPLPVQYVKFVTNAIRLDFGRSYFYAIPATDLVASRLWPTVQLGLMSYLIGLLGIPLGVYAAMHRGKAGDLAVLVLTTIGHSMPPWWFGLMSILALSSLVGWFPQGIGQGNPIEWLKYIILPATVLGLSAVVTFSRFVRSEVLEVLGQDYVRTANAKGLADAQVTWGHVLRNALMPVVTLLGYLLPAVLGGSVLTETIFNWPGLGRLFIESASSRDYPVLMALLTMGTFATILGTLLADLGYGVVDPRVRYT
jgi:peptide/nickel transport system permease protein